MKWWDTLSDEEQEKLSKGMFILMRWASSTGSHVDAINEHYLKGVNDNVNVHFNLMRHHPKMQHRLLQAIGVGSNQTHPWIKPGKRKKKLVKNAKLFDFYLAMYPHFSDEEIVFVISSMDKPEIVAMLEDAGIDKKKHKEYLK